VRVEGVEGVSRMRVLYAAPEAAQVQVELGGTLKELHRDAEADEAFSHAMQLAKAHRPDDQSKQVAALIAAAVASQH
jgi:hypothetical protein